MRHPLTRRDKVHMALLMTMHTFSSAATAFGIAAKLNLSAMESADALRRGANVENVAACLDAADVLFLAAALPYVVYGVMLAGVHTCDSVGRFFAGRRDAAIDAIQHAVLAATDEQANQAALLEEGRGAVAAPSTPH